jgi:hypothetical protein
MITRVLDLFPMSTVVVGVVGSLNIIKQHHPSANIRNQKHRLQEQYIVCIEPCENEGTEPSALHLSWECYLVDCTSTLSLLKRMFPYPN